ncbi:hypothetical protein WN982_11330 [Paraburkholderia sp. IMGN_8]|uniref:hypothetical protein n=1 Tax=Paraburkholderia sp. IMGN_8 TaxID=3136564 RepID=UPI003100F95A
MLRHFTVTTGTVLAITTLSGLAAINQAVTSHYRVVSTTVQAQTALMNDTVESTVDAGNVPLSPSQLAVLLEGFDRQALLVAAQSL